MTFTDLITRTPKEVYFLLLGVVIIGIIAGLIEKYLKKLEKHIKKSLKQSPKLSQKQSQKNHEKQLKKLDKVYGTYTIAKVDKMTGQEFELFVERLFRVLEKDKISKTEFTPTTGDQGCDLIVHYRDGQKLGIQCKRYADKVSNKAVQNIVAAKAMYGLTLMMVFTNNYYTPGAQEAARSNRVELVDRDQLTKMINRHNETLRTLHAKS